MEPGEFSGNWRMFTNGEQFSVGSKGKTKAEENSEYLMFPNSVTRRVYNKKKSGKQAYFRGIW